DNGLAEMDADSDPHRLRQVSSQSAVELGDARQHLARSMQGVGGTGRGILGVEPVKGHQPIAGKLRVIAVGGIERLDHLVEELIENVKEVIGKFGLTQA